MDFARTCYRRVSAATLSCVLSTAAAAAIALFERKGNVVSAARVRDDLERWRKRA